MVQKKAPKQNHARSASGKRSDPATVTLPIGYQSLDSNGRIIEVNQRWCDTLGYSRGEVVGRWFGDFLAPESVPRFREQFPSLCTKGEVHNVELKLARKDGSRLTVLFDGCVERDSRGESKRTHCVFHNITERKNLEAALTHERLKYQEFFENLPLLVYSVGIDGIIKDCNQLAVSTLGYANKEELVGRPLTTTVYSPASQEKAEALFEKWKQTGHLRNEELQVRTQQGALLDVLLNVDTVYDEEGKALSTLSTHVDITERTRLQRLIEHSEKRYRELFDNMSSGVAVYEARADGEDFVFTDFNRAAEQIENIRREEVIGKSILEVFPGIKEFGLFDVFQRVWRTGNSEHHPVRQYRDERIAGWRENHVYKLPSAEIVAVYDDVTEQRRAEEEVREREERFRSLVTGASDSISMTDLNGNILFVNEAGLTLHGATSVDEVIGKNAFGLIAQEDQIAAREGMELVLREGIAKNREYLLVTADGRKIPVEMTVSLIRDAEGNPFRFMAVTRDISERKQAEQQLRKSLEGTIRALGHTTATRDPYTDSHQRRATELACAIAEKMGLSKDRIEAIHAAGQMHDIGKLSVPAEILSKPGLLTDTEYALLQEHPQVAYDILKAIDFPWPVAQIVLQHHERLDGSGYPQGLKAEEILLEARILAVADVVEAMSSHRPYRPALGIEKALEEITAHRGSQYDPDVVDACVDLFRSGEFRFTD